MSDKLMVLSCLLMAAATARAEISPVEARAELEKRGNSVLTPEARKGGETGRPYEVYAHDEKAQRAFFIVVPPVSGHRKGAPLAVLLHSAGCMVSSNRCVQGMGPNHLPSMLRKGNTGIYSIPDDFYAIFPDCGLVDGDWWWGNGNGSKVQTEVTPCERRVLAEIEWVLTKYDIDRNRVYMAGNSMGGSGTLGFALRHGELFAAVKANVPAGVGHALGGIARWKQTPADVRAEPPVILDYSAPNDGWSSGHEKLVAAMREMKFSYHLYWGLFGHNGLHAKVRPYNDLYEGLDWLNIRRNEAYPVFTDASTDEKIPWPCDAGGAKTQRLPPGEINAYFRWKNVTDTADSFAMDLWLVSAEEAKSKLFKIPTESVADLTIRRLQKFRLRAGDKVAWTFGTEKGEAVADETGHITLPRLHFTTAHKRLTISGK